MVDAEEDAALETGRPTRRGRDRGKGKRKAQDDDDEGEGEEVDVDADADVEAEPEDDADAAADAEDEDGEGDVEDGASSSRRSSKRREDDGDDEGKSNEFSPLIAEKAQKRKDAVVSLTEIEVEFAKLRDRLHDDKVARLRAEIEMCLDGTHPELSGLYDQIAHKRDDRITLARAHWRYRRRCVENQIKAMRVHIHQQYYKNRADLRAKMILDTTQRWYQVNRERRAMDALVPRLGYRIPEKKQIIVRELQAQYDEIAILSGLSKYIGFPAAPEVKSASQEEIYEDLQALGIDRTVRDKHPDINAPIM
ncbi:Sds3-like-domain-containing protein [Dipodascopsis tothii]|uniref:Sds3-like-domain-containing protein n=1 Tax=Dipodascopsis tothii TaxID=44089 RepID=UPI0034CDA983